MPVAVNNDGQFNHDHDVTTELLGEGGDEFTNNAIADFTEVVTQPGVTTGEIIQAAAELKMKLGASKAYYDVISTLGDSMQRLIEGAVK